MIGPKPRSVRSVYSSAIALPKIDPPASNSSRFGFSSLNASIHAVVFSAEHEARPSDVVGIHALPFRSDVTRIENDCVARIAVSGDIIALRIIETSFCVILPSLSQSARLIAAASIMRLREK